MNKTQVSVRLDAIHVRELRDLQLHCGNTASEVARYLIVESLFTFDSRVEQRAG